ncbi:hypothetical protein [Rhizobium sp. Rhizsp42]|uniref:hypothetical protein n=1 Tax=Rhizobium sp. Rhizsp42 TaxID=3243034 RepID=UPI0039AFADAE
MKQMRATGKIALADMMGDAAILKAMKTNEDNTVTAYERAARYEGCGPGVEGLFRPRVEASRLDGDDREDALILKNGRRHIIYVSPPEPTIVGLPRNDFAGPADIRVN